MTVLWVILLVLLSFFALVFLLLLPKFSIRIIYDGSLSVYAGYSFIPIKLHPKKKKGKSKKSASGYKFKNKNAKKSPKKDMAKDNADAAYEKHKASHNQSKSSVLDTITFIFEIIKKTGEMFGKHGEITIKKLLISVGKEDACDTAVQFGLMCSVMSTGLALCSLFGRAGISHENVKVTPDFITGKSSASADVKIAVRGIFIVVTAFKILVNKFLKNS